MVFGRLRKISPDKKARLQFISQALEYYCPTEAALDFKQSHELVKEACLYFTRTAKAGLYPQPP
jgi:hypothetical protein